MEIAGTILSIIGFVIVFAGALGLYFNRAAKNEEKDSPVDSDIDFFYFGGLISFFSELFGACGDAIKKGSSSPYFSLMILMVSGLAMMAAGITLSWLSFS